VPWWATVLVALGSAFVGALASGGAQAWLAWRDRVARKEVAARAIMGDIAVARYLFEKVAHGAGHVGIDHDFGSALAAWDRYRPDLIRELTLAEWAEVSQFYEALALVAAMCGKAELTPGDVAAARSQVALADRAWPVARDHVGGTDAEQKELVERLEAATPAASGD
jgi:hypothetical protein